MTFKELMDVVLEDDDTDYGGVAFDGETVGDFLYAIDFIGWLNSCLKECGIKPIKF